MILTVVCLIALTMTAGSAFAVTEVIGYDAVTNAYLNFAGNGGLGSALNPPTFYFTAPSSADFSITSSSTGASNGDLGSFSGTWTITSPITTEGTAEIAGVSGSGTLTIIDHSSVPLTATIQWLKIETNTAGSNGSLNDTLVANISGVSYSGTEADLLNLMNAAIAGDLTWTMSTTGLDLTALTTSGAFNKTAAWSGEIIASPVPATALLFGSGLLGLALLGFRRKRMAFQP